MEQKKTQSRKRKATMGSLYDFFLIRGGRTQIGLLPLGLRTGSFAEEVHLAGTLDGLDKAQFKEKHLGLVNPPLAAFPPHLRAQRFAPPLAFPSCADRQHTEITIAVLKRKHY
jgi:hypothetical protein